MVVPIFRRGLLAAAQARPTTGSSTGPVSTSESQRESNPNSSRPVTSSARASLDEVAPPELRAVRGVVASILGMLEGGSTHLGVATDHVIESFRNQLWPGYKTGEGMDPLLHAQFEPFEEALSALGVVVWPMVEFEADDALAAATTVAAADARVDQVVICTPDKDLAQCV